MGKAQPDLIPIGEVAKRYGVAPSALRYYEERGLLAPATWNGGRRWYGRTELRHLALIRIAQQLGIDLDDIADLLHPDGTGWRDLVTSTIDRLQRQREWIDTTLTTLHSTTTCPRDHPLDCPHLTATLDNWIDNKFENAPSSQPPAT